MNFFVTGTDTDVGKSYICKHLAKEFIKMGKKTGYLKPFQSGLEEGIDPDAKQIETIAKGVIAKSTYITKTPCTPYISSQIDNVDYNLEKVKQDYTELANICDVTIVEGSGGLYVPVKENVLMSDVIKFLNLPALIVARPNLGTINHTLMTIKCAQSEGIKILGVVISNCPQTTNDPVILRAQEMIEKYCNTKVIDTIKQGQTDLSKLAQKLS